MTDEERGQEEPQHVRGTARAAPLAPAQPEPARPFAEDEVTEWLGDVTPPAAAPGPGVRRTALAVVLVLILGALAAMVTYLVRSPGRAPGSAGESRQEAAAVRWVVQQVSPEAGVACDPVICAALRARGFPARGLLVLGPRSQSPVGADVVVETPAVLSLFGSSLATAWAPSVLASFGSGPGAITVRVMASNGAAAYQTLLGIDLADRKSAGAALLNDPQITVPATARAQLTAGAVDLRLLLAVTALAGHQPVSIAQFGDLGPGASPGVPLRAVDLAEDVRAAHLAPAAYVNSARAYLSTVDSKFRPASMTTAVLPGGRAVLRVEFAAPSPLGMSSNQFTP